MLKQCPPQIVLAVLCASVHATNVTAHVVKVSVKISVEEWMHILQQRSSELPTSCVSSSTSCDLTPVIHVPSYLNEHVLTLLT